MKKFRMVSVLAMALVLLTSTSALAKEQQQIRTIVNPVLLELGLDTSNNGRFASSPAPATTASTTPITVSSYQEYKHVMVNAIRNKKERVILILSPNVDDKKDVEWEQNLTGFWFDLGTRKGFVGDLFKEIPWLAEGWDQIGASATGQSVNYEIDYPYSSEEEISFEKELFQKEKEIISPEMNDYKREKAIYDWIVNHVDYDYDALDDINYSDYGAFKKGLAICNGYAVLTDRMLAMAGIDDQIVVGLVGVGDTAGAHAWNLAKICGRWYHVDTTWDDPSGNYPVLYDYFNLSDTEISESRDWIRKFYPTAPQPFDQSCEWATEQSRCSLFHPELCKDEMACIRISGHWCNNQCQMKACAQPIPQPIPTGRNIIRLTGSEIEKAPVYLDIATDGDQMELSLNFPAYAGPVNEYVIVQLPNGAWLFFGPNGFTTKVVAYKVGVTSAQREKVFNPFNAYKNGQTTVLLGQWIVCSLVCPTSNGGDLANYELIYYSFIIHP